MQSDLFKALGITVTRNVCQYPEITLLEPSSLSGTTGSNWLGTFRYHLSTLEKCYIEQT